MVRAIRTVLFFLHVLMGMGGLAGGYAAVTEPQGPFGISMDMLEHSPFRSFLIPGLFLFIVIGLGNFASAMLIPFRRRWQGYASGAMGGVLAAWIVIQCVMIRMVEWQHVFTFALGAAMGFLALALLARENLWPGTWAVRALSLPAEIPGRLFSRKRP